MRRKFEILQLICTLHNLRINFWNFASYILTYALNCTSVLSRWMLLQLRVWQISMSYYTLLQMQWPWTTVIVRFIDRIKYNIFDLHTFIVGLLEWHIPLQLGRVHRTERIFLERHHILRYMENGAYGVQ